jgi:hypothetical protein
VIIRCALAGLKIDSAHDDFIAHAGFAASQCQRQNSAARARPMASIAGLTFAPVMYAAFAEPLAALVVTRGIVANAPPAIIGNEAMQVDVGIACFTRQLIRR